MIPMGREKHFVKLKLDIIFKKVFGDKDNKEALASLLSALLEIPMEEIGEITLDNVEMPPEMYETKFSRLDLKLTLDGRVIDIEIQITNQEDFKERSLFYWAKMFSKNLKAGDEYKTIYTADFENDLFRDIASAEISVAAACSFISSRQLNLLINAADSCTQKGAKFSFITKRSDNIYQKRLLHLFSAHSISAAVKNKLTHSFVVIDSRTVWYSSRELFSASDDNCVLRIEDEVLAWELMDSIK